MLRRRYGTRERGTSLSGRPAIETSPRLGSSSFMSSRMQVDSQPVGPTRKTNSPRPIRIEADWTATEPPS